MEIKAKRVRKPAKYCKSKKKTNILFSLLLICVESKQTEQARAIVFFRFGCEKERGKAKRIKGVTLGQRERECNKKVTLTFVC